MPELTPKLGIKKPLGNETVSRAAYNENWDILDEVVAKEEDLTAVQSAVDAHLADYANPHRVKAEQVFSIGGIPSGTTFPTSPASYTLFFRTDLNKLFVYLP